jgi:release factor glutamine methyltransferase
MADRLTVRQALAGSNLAPIDAQVLLAHALDVDRAWLIAHATDSLTGPHVERFSALARRRRDGEPVAYLTGSREFRGLSLEVDPSVLIPRPETETLVDCALRHLAVDRPLRVLDLGTGSGAIALAIAQERPRAAVLGTDRSAAALAVARKNAGRMKLANLRWLQCDWYGELHVEGPRFHLIASNPPYVADGDPHLREGDLRFEPRSALCAGADGLDALRIIIGGARERLVAGGALVVEHGYDQAESVRALMADAGFTKIESLRDLSGIPRIALANSVSEV